MWLSEHETFQLSDILHTLKCFMVHMNAKLHTLTVLGQRAHFGGSEGIQLQDEREYLAHLFLYLLLHRIAVTQGHTSIINCHGHHQNVCYKQQAIICISKKQTESASQGNNFGTECLARKLLTLFGCAKSQQTVMASRKQGALQGPTAHWVP